MGEAKRRGTLEERTAQAVKAAKELADKEKEREAAWNAKQAERRKEREEAEAEAERKSAAIRSKYPIRRKTNTLLAVAAMVAMTANSNYKG